VGALEIEGEDVGWIKEGTGVGEKDGAQELPLNRLKLAGTPWIE
jgi:hypothetical protein